MPENHKKGNQNISGQLSRPQRNTYYLRTNFGQSLIRINEPRHSIICPSKRRESWSRFILSVTQEHFRSTPLALCTFYPLILSIFSTTSSHIITQVQYCSILSALGSAEKTRQCCQKAKAPKAPPTSDPSLPSFRKFLICLALPDSDAWCPLFHCRPALPSHLPASPVLVPLFLVGSYETLPV